MPWIGNGRKNVGEGIEENLCAADGNFESPDSVLSPCGPTAINIIDAGCVDDFQSPFHHQQDSVQLPAPHRIPSAAIENSLSVNELIEKSEDFTLSLRDMGVTKLGTFTIPDTDATRVFGTASMLTRGSNQLHGPNWKQNWKDFIASKKSWFNRPSVIDGWSEHVTVGAYAVNIKRIAERKSGALLTMMLAKTRAGAISRTVWEYPCIRALINYHWSTWARTFLLCQLIFYALWCLVLFFYLILYIEYDLKHIICGPADRDEYAHIIAMTHVISILCFVMMCPFAYLEIFTLYKQREKWIQGRNLIDVTVLILQALFFTCHSLRVGVGSYWYGVLLTVHTILMFFKLQDYGRTLGLGTSYIETFLAVIYDVRYFILAFGMTVVTIALCLGTLYKEDTHFHKGHREFKGVFHTLVTTFAIIFGQFDVRYVFDASHPWTKGVFFFSFQILITVTIMNLLIAVMTESYSKFAKQQRLTTNMSRAYVIDELQLVRIPRFFTKKFHPFIHFLVIEQKTKSMTELLSRSSGSPTISITELRNEVNILKNSIQNIVKLLDAKQQAISSQETSAEDLSDQ